MVLANFGKKYSPFHFYSPILKNPGILGAVTGLSPRLILSGLESNICLLISIHGLVVRPLESFHSVAIVNILTESP